MGTTTEINAVSTENLVKSARKALSTFAMLEKTTY